MSDRRPPRFRLVDDDELANVTCNVVVAIAADPLTGAVLNAAYSWPAFIHDGDRRGAGSVGPLNVMAAFMEARIFAAAHGLRSVVVSMDPVLEWNSDWGELDD